MTKEIEFHDNGEITVVFGKEYRLPRPTFGQKKLVAKKVAAIGDKINTLSQQISAQTQALIDEAGGDDQAVDTEKFVAIMGSLDEAVFVLLFDTWKEIVEVLAGEKPEIELDDAPLWAAHTDLLNDMIDHWQTNPLASTQSQPTLTAVK